MNVNKYKNHIVTKFLISTVSCSIFQLIVLIFLMVLEFIIWYISGAITYLITKNNLILNIVPSLLSYSAIAILYGLIWYGFWRFLYKDGIKWFYYRILFSIIPLILILVNFNPRPDPMAMINVPSEPIFSSLVTGIILLPIYSVIVYKFVLQKSHVKMKKKFSIFVIIICVGLIIFITSWNIMRRIYNM